VGVKIQKEIEPYDEVMEIHPKYPYIWYKLGLAYYAIGYKQRLKNILIKVNHKI
jgi:tetratricopeptide (TPR) repeat protein